MSIKKDGQGGRAVSQPDRETRQSFFSRDFTVTTWTGERLGRWEIFAKSSSGFRVSRPLLKSPQSEGGLLWTFLLHLGGGEATRRGFQLRGREKSGAGWWCDLSLLPAQRGVCPPFTQVPRRRDQKPRVRPRFFASPVALPRNTSRERQCMG